MVISLQVARTVSKPDSFGVFSAPDLSPSPDLSLKQTSGEPAAMSVITWILVASLLFVSAQADSKNNPADELVAVLNKNRTAHKSSALADNQGLGCISLQYIKAYQGNCEEVGGADAKKPADADFAENFAPNCGVEVSTLSVITGRLLGCQSNYISPSEAFSKLLIHNNVSLEILYSKYHTEVGAAVSGSDGGSPYFWCVLFSNGTANSSFVLEGGVAKTQRPGCYSGNNDDCSGANAWHSSPWSLTIGLLIALSYTLGL